MKSVVSENDNTTNAGHHKIRIPKSEAAIYSCNQPLPSGVFLVGRLPCHLTSQEDIRGKNTEMKTFGKLKTLGLATALTATAVAGSIVVAQSVTPKQDNEQQGRQWRRGGRGGDRQHNFGGMRGNRLFSQLNLTEDQKTKVKQLHANFAERNKPLRQELRARRQELQQARQGDTFNELLATQKLTEIATIEAKLMGEQFKLHQEMLTILTPEQKTQLEQAKAQFKAKRGSKPGRGERRINQ
jgi:Spy/CpxP family protein refolding chaperone